MKNATRWECFLFYMANISLTLFKGKFIRQMLFSDKFANFFWIKNEESKNVKIQFNNFRVRQ